MVLAASFVITHISLNTEGMHAQCVLVYKILRYKSRASSSSIYGGVLIKSHLGFKKEVVTFPGKEE